MSRTPTDAGPFLAVPAFVIGVEAVLEKGVSPPGVLPWPGGGADDSGCVLVGWAVPVGWAVVLVGWAVPVGWGVLVGWGVVGGAVWAAVVLVDRCAVVADGEACRGSDDGGVACRVVGGLSLVGWECSVKLCGAFAAGRPVVVGAGSVELVVEGFVVGGGVVVGGGCSPVGWICSVAVFPDVGDGVVLAGGSGGRGGGWAEGSAVGVTPV
ncbi:hypothetical protein ACFQE5_12825 [Pseudonocardia hispaniensis]|uniref:Uncharacterized protein n=1 Tax=Pseudonocardia hispaniensis TaxID=904933 RepID=A0ABW1J3A3_9PSEU